MIITNLNRDSIREIIYFSDGQAIDGLWHRLDMITIFSDRSDTFIWLLEYLLREGRIKLHKNGIFLKSSIEDQIKVFKEAFPRDERDADRICTKPGMEVPYEGFGMNVWWHLDSCPAGIAWRQPDGHYEIAA